ncbi:MAG: hypothetical protein GXO73_08530 [Calditrichaeota bacterium]|nr:hypothetical protein [Calditrichota bacterium]
MSQVAVRFTEQVHSGVQLWLEGAHDLYEGYEPFSGLRNQLYVWRLDWSATPVLRLRYWGRHFARDVDSPGLTSEKQALGTSLPFLPLVAKHRKDSWTDHVLEATWRPDSLGERELTITAAAGRGTAERSYWDLKCPAFVSKLSEGQLHVSFRRKRLRILGSIDRFREQPEGGTGETWMAWRARVSQRLSGILGGDVELGAGLGGGASKGFRKAGPEAFLRFGRAFGAVRAETELLTDTWLPSHELLPCSKLSSRAGHLTRRTKATFRLKSGSEGWSWLAHRNWSCACIKPAPGDPRC